MTSWDIKRALMADRYRRNFCLPNYTPTNWFECDVFELTKAGYFREYEIKISRSDFRADALKAKEKYGFTGKQIEVVERTTKHERLARNDPAGPTRFWYVTPEKLLSLEEIPPWAGLISARAYGPGLILHTEKEAPSLHSQQADKFIREHSMGVCYWRLLNHFVHGKAITESGGESALTTDGEQA